MPNSLPKKALIANRILAVLKSVTAGDDFYVTPLDVFLGYKQSVSGYPALSVRDEPGGVVENGGDYFVSETFYLAVHGEVRDAGDVVTPRLLVLRDVRKAITDDFKGEAGAGSLRTLADDICIEGAPELQDGPEGTGFFGYFKQKIKVLVSGLIEDL